MPETGKSDLIRLKEIEHRNIVKEYFKLVSSGRFKEGLHFFAPDCKTHNPFVGGNMTVLTDAMITANKEGASKYPEAEFSINLLLADRDFVAAHT